MVWCGMESIWNWRPTQIKKMDEVSTDFVKEFRSDKPNRNMKFKWRNRKQGPVEDIKSYFFDLVTLVHEVDAQMADEKFYKHFEKGLRP